MKQDLFKSACRIHTACMVTRYLICNTAGRLDGAEKAHVHSELCKFYVAAVRGHDDPDTVRQRHEADYHSVHNATQALTDYMDEVIGFPIEGRPDYDRLEPLFFEKFHALATQALLRAVE